MRITKSVPSLTFALPALWLCACAAGADDMLGMPSEVAANGGAPAFGEPAGDPGAPVGGGAAPVGGAGTSPPVTDGTGTVDPGIAGMGSLGGDFAGTGGVGGTGALAGMGGTGATFPPGACCSDGDCLCHGPDPSMLTSSNGPYATSSYSVTEGKIFYPTNGEPPYSGIAICPGFINSGPEMEPWGPFYASHGFVMIAVNTLGTDFPDIRATKLLAGVDRLAAENDNPSSAVYGLLAGRYGTSGYSMGGGGTTIASGQDASLRTSIGLAAWGPVTNNVQVATLLLCGSSDTTAPCSMSQGGYTSLPAATPKMMISISGATHFSWFSPTGAGSGTSGAYALAFQKVYLDGDERWKPLLLQKPSNGTVTTTIQ